jgi:hypothetical protein
MSDDSFCTNSERSRTDDPGGRHDMKITCSHIRYNYVVCKLAIQAMFGADLFYGDILFVSSSSRARLV